MEENTSRPSGLKPPSTKLPTLVSSHSSHRNQGLYEITDSQNNARSQYTATGLANGLKRNAPAPGGNTLPSSKTTLAHLDTKAAVPDAKRKPMATGIDFQGKTPGTSIASTKAVKGASLKDLVGGTTPLVQNPTELETPTSNWRRPMSLRFTSIEARWDALVAP
ncbi:hypothetical protein EKO27_g11990 [Xylaria grammica]|uniref:Uncharacterized protein n=1 Tax=Xylaria grammica TaxID=363999 RepID=A0A439CLT2_9PEZI|nr:hypothetical protein EKO27_g11990 [Xylaria grammica]